MVKRAGLVVLAIALAASLGFAVVRGQDGRAPDLVVHEWGTFTSVAGPDGQAVPWHPLSGSSDLPCFVRLLSPGDVKVALSPGNTGAPVSWLSMLRARVRMETPVLYFYSPRETTVDVRVQFPHGLITEWYPQAVVPGPFYPINFSTAGSISWRAVQVRPAAKPDFPTEPGSSHYYAARATDAAPVAANGQLEKFLFYRGLADFPPALRARETGNNSVLIENTDASVVPHLLLFESDGKNFGYRVATALGKHVTLARPALTSDLASLRRDLGAMLVAEGLFPKEAEAMLDTWRDSWFEPGLRVLYLVPRSTADAILPLAITPAPQTTARVFVGRMEILTSEMQDTIARDLGRKDYLALSKYGRFLEPAMDQMWNRASEGGRRQIEEAFASVSKILASAETTCQAPGNRH
ncbi:MAG TPA: hypothetical protein VJN96_15925 [Vicinamibacterales bacterium]|nr:hypothetical protein [Vicinamibacterales bacterium]